MMKRRIATVLLLLSMFPVLALAEQERYTIREIRDQAEQLLEAYGSVGTIEVETTKGRFNVTIEIPEVDRVPIVQITFPSFDQVPSAPENGEVTVHTLDYLSTTRLSGWAVELNRDNVYGTWVKNTTRVDQYGLDAQADGSPMTMEESIAFAEQMLLPYKELYGWEFSLQEAVAYSRRYKAIAGRNGFIPKMDQPVGDTGYYLLVFNQTFYGIPYYGHMLFIYPSKNDRKGGYPLGDLHFSVFSPDAYVYSIYPSVEQAVLAEDVPLCSLETCIKALKNSGRNSDQTPTKLKLGYYSFNDPNDRNGDHLILVPVWVMDSYNTFVNAQTGEWINMEQKDTDGGRRYDAVWFGWEEGK